MAAFQTILYLGIVLLLARPLGWYMARVYNGKRVWLTGIAGWVEEKFYRLAGINPAHEMHWLAYVLTVVSLGLLGFFLLFAILLLQGALPLNPQDFPGLPADQAFNAAISFVTNTNWQNYGGETTLSYFSQMVGLVVQHFLSAASGMAVAVALFRGLTRRQAQTIGNAWVDITRSILYILLPLALLLALLLVSQGVIQNMDAYTSYVPLEHGSGQEGLIAQGPVASQAAIKLLGSNGGGFFNANSAHPFANPGPFANLLSILAILLLPVAMVCCFGNMVGDRRQGWMLLAAMTIIFLPLAAFTGAGESDGNPLLDSTVIDQSAGNMEGKEMRFGAVDSALWAAATTATSNGSVNSMHDSYLPLSGMAPMLLMQFGEVIYGGVGSGMYGMLIYVLITVFIGGLMVGRTPEYLGKKLGPFEIKMASLVIILPACMALAGSAIAVSVPAGAAGPLNVGAQAFSEILYAFSSAANNNGSAFAGLNANTPFYNIMLGICMFVGRYWVLVPVLAIAGTLAARNRTPLSPGTLPTHTPLFTMMLVGVVLLLGVLTYVPALALGPIAEHMDIAARLETAP